MGRVIYLLVKLKLTLKELRVSAESEKALNLIRELEKNLDLGGKHVAN